MKRVVSLTLFLCCLSTLVVGKTKLDSLMQNAKEHLKANENEEACSILTHALTLSTDSWHLKERAIIYNNLGVASWRQGNYKESLKSYQHALDTYKKIGNDTLIAQSQYNLGLTLKGLGSNQLAAKNFTKAVRLFEKIGDEKQIAMVYDALGNIYKDLKDYEKAIYYHQSAMKIYERLQYSKGVSRSAHNLGQVYSDLGDYQNAREQLFRAKKIKESLQLSVASNYAQIGTLFTRIDKLDSAEYFFLRSLDERKRENNPAKLTSAYWHLGVLFIEKKDLKNARIMLDKAFVIADSLALNQSLIDIVRSQIEIGKLEGENINGKYELLIALQEQVLGENSRKAMARFEVEYDVLKKDQEINAKNNLLQIKEIENEQLSFRNLTLFWGIILSLIFILSVVYFYFKLRKSKKETELKNEQISESHKQIDYLNKELTHRTKNYFQMFGGMLKYDRTTIKDPAILSLIEKYIQRVEAMSQIQRYLLIEEATQKEVQLNLYLEELLANIDLVLNQANKEVEIYSSFTPILCDYDIALRVGLVMNEMVSNSFEHGFQSIQNPRIKIQLEENTQQEISLTIQDNGVGLRQNEINQYSMGIKLMNMILSSVNGQINYEKTKKTGTYVMITCPRRRKV